MGCKCAQEKAAGDVDARAAAHKVRRLKRKSADLEPSATITVTASASHAGELAPRCAALKPNPNASSHAGRLAPWCASLDPTPTSAGRVCGNATFKYALL